MTYVTGFFLVFAGMLVGHFLWYRDRTEEDNLRNKLSLENDDLKGKLGLDSAAYAELEDRYSRQEGRLNVLQQLCDDWSETREQVERERTELEVELNNRSKKFDEMLTALQEEKARRMQVEEDYHHLQQQQMEKVSLIESTWKKDYSKLESNFMQRQNELNNLTGSHERTAEKLHQAEGRIAELMAELESRRTMLDSATKNVSGLEKEYVTLESSLAHSSDLLKKSQADCAAAMSARKLVEAEVRDLRAQSDLQQERIVELEGKAAEYSALRGQMAQVEDALGCERERLETVTRERDQALQAEKTAIGMATGLQNRIDNQESTIKLLRTEKEQSLENLKCEISARTEIESTVSERLTSLQQRLNDRDETIATLTRQRDELAAQAGEDRQLRAEIESTIEERLAGMASRLQEREASIAAITQQRDQYLERANEYNQRRTELESTVEERLAGMAAKLKEREDSISLLTQQRDRFMEQSNEHSRARTELESTVQERISGLTTKLQERESTIESLTSQRDQFIEKANEQTRRRTEVESTIEERVAGLRARLAERDETIRLLTAQRDEWQVQTASFESRIASMSTVDHSGIQAELAQRDATIGRLRSECDQLLAASQKDKELLHQTQLRLEELAKLRLSNSSELEETLSELEKLRIKHASCDSTILKLREERAAAYAQLAAMKQAADAEPAIIRFQARPDYDEEYGGATAMHDERGLIYTEAPKDWDDLKLISGIAVVLEERLNNYGIYTFKQIMNWSERSVAEFSTLLSFKDRIDRDDWKGQARYFYQQKVRERRANQVSRAA